ncbi:MAG: hypothetical protein V3V30_08355 [Parvularculaceae bacterium]
MEPNNRQDLIEIMAKEAEIPLYRRFTEAQSASIIGISLPTLRRIRARGEIAYLKVSERRIQFLGLQLCSYLVDQIQEVSCPKHHQSVSSNSENTGLANGKNPAPTTNTGTMEKLDKRDAFLSAQRTLMKPRKN